MLARMSSEVIASWRFVGTPRERMQASERRSRMKTHGLKSVMMQCIGRTTNIATASGRAIASRFGRRSAKITKSVVAIRNEITKLMRPQSCPGRISASSHWKKGEKAASPTMPPKSAVAFSPICRAEKNCPGCSRISNTMAARRSPSSESAIKRVFEAAEREISAEEKNALRRTRQNRPTTCGREEIMRNPIGRTGGKRNSGRRSRDFPIVRNFYAGSTAN